MAAPAAGVPAGTAAAQRRGPAVLALAFAAAWLAPRSPRRHGEALFGISSVFVPTHAVVERDWVATAPRALLPPRSAAAVRGPPATAVVGVRGFGAAVGAAVLALLAARSRVAVGSRPSPRVALRARSPFPTTPMGNRGARRQRAGPRAFLHGRQIQVRVNPKTNKPIRFRMHVKAGDIVQVMKGKDKGKITQVLKTYNKWNRVLCLGVNFCIKHVRPIREDEVGQRVQVEAPMHSSVVMHYCEKKKVAGYLGIRYQKFGDKIYKVRYNKASGEKLPKNVPPKWVPVLERVDSSEE